MTQLSSPRQSFLCLCAALLLCFASTAFAEHHEEGQTEPTVADHVRGLEAMCAENSEAMAARQSEKSLYERLGGKERIHEIVAEVVRLHGVNESIKHTLDGVDQEHLINMVTEFLVVGSGGPGEYTGHDMVKAHEHLKLTNEHFLAAGSDVMTAMKSLGCEENEIHEVVCALVALRSHVVIESEKDITSK